MSIEKRIDNLDAEKAPEITLVALLHSSNLAAYGYDKASKTFRVEFKNKATWDYIGVLPLVLRNFEQAASKGSYFSQHIRNNKFYTARQVTFLKAQSLEAATKPLGWDGTPGAWYVNYIIGIDQGISSRGSYVVLDTREQELRSIAAGHHLADAKHPQVLSGTDELKDPLEVGRNLQKILREEKNR